MVSFQDVWTLNSGPPLSRCAKIASNAFFLIRKSLRCDMRIGVYPPHSQHSRTQALRRGRRCHKVCPASLITLRHFLAVNPSRGSQMALFAAVASTMGLGLNLQESRVRNPDRRPFNQSPPTKRSSDLCQLHRSIGIFRLRANSNSCPGLGKAHFAPRLAAPLSDTL